MTSGPLSLRRRLMFWLLIPLALMAVALVFEAYINAKNSTERIYDQILVTLALSIAEYVIGSEGDLVPEDALALMTSTINERIFYKVTGPDSAFITGHWDLPGLPPKSKLEGGIPLFYNATYQNQPVRAVGLSFLVEGRGIDGWMLVQVIQTRGERDRVIFEAVLSATVRILLVIGLVAIFAWVGVTRGLEPLVNLQNAIGRRSYDDLRPITREMPTEVHRVVGALNRLLERLSESIDSQRRFIANASHQLRTPLAVLQAEVELALRDVKDEKSRDALTEIQYGTRQTSRLANQLLSLARVRSNPAGGSQTAFDLVATAQDVTRDWVRRPIAKEKDLGFETEMPSLPMVGREVQIRELLANLIDNALRYGGETITVRTDREDGLAVLEVEDNGLGIPHEMRERVFERFVRLDERAGEGCGLGLDIVREIAEGHGGGIELLDCPDDQGLRVRVTLKAAEEES